MLASCSSDGEVLIWSLRDAAVHRRHRTFGRVYSIGMGERTIACGGEGSMPVRLYDWRDGRLVWEAGDADEAPKGVTTCLHRDGSLLAAGNSDTHSQLRIWDLRANPNGDGSLRDCFSLPPYVKGLRCVCAPTPHTLVCGTTNGWLVHIDLRSGKYEKKSSHTDCVNGLALVRGAHLLASGGDDKMVRLFDTRKGAFAPLGSHKLRSVVYSLSADDETLYAGVEGGDLRAFDYSAEANPLQAAGQAGMSGGFTSEQKAALAAAVAGARMAAGQRRGAASGAAMLGFG